MSKVASDLKKKQMNMSNPNYVTHLVQFGLKCALLACFLISTESKIDAQSWLVTVGGQKEDLAQSVITTIDHGTLVVGISESFGDDNDVDILAIRTDVDGTIVWQRIYDEAFKELASEVIELEDGSFLIVGYIEESLGDPQNVYLLKADRRGNTLWSKRYPAAYNERGTDIKPALDGGFIIVGQTEKTESGDDDILVLKVDDEGEEEWRHSFGANDRDDIGRGIVTVSDGYIVAANVKENTGTSNNVGLFKLDAAGNFVWSKFYGANGSNDEVNDLLLTQNNEVVFVGSADNFNKALAAKVSLNGDIQWYQEIDAALYDDEARSIIELHDGSLIIAGYSSPNQASSYVLLLKLKPDGSTVWKRNVGEDNAVNTGADVAATADGGLVIAGYSSEVIVFINDVILTKLDAENKVNTNRLSGNISHLLDGCGGVDARPLQDWLVKVEGEDITYYGSSDANGRYSINVDTGSYQVTLLKPNDYWSVCNPVAFIAEFTEFYDTTVTNFSAFAAEDCPWMEVDVTVPYLYNNQAQCEDATYTINYCNLGPVAAEDAYIEVQLDEKLHYKASGITPASNDPETNSWTFVLGDIASTQCGSFTILVGQDCENYTDGEAIVVQARIFPNEPCIEPDPNWDRSSIDVVGFCERDTVQFRIRNVGDSPMAIESNYIVIEDQVLFRQGTIDPLQPQEERFIKFPSTGSTYRIVADQSDGHPGRSLPTYAVEGCATEGTSLTVGYYNDFPENDRDANIDIDVQEVISPEETTRLKGHPEGYQGYILDQLTDIEYTILFSNVGTDTIDRVVIRDTLSPHLDINSVELGASSHPYDFEIYNQGILKITFDRIQLQPAGSAEEASTRGFVKFRISQKPNNPLGTEIANSAAVYFDYHAPQVTNPVTYEIGCTSFLQQGCIEIDTKVSENFPGVKIKVAPNPFFDRVTFDIEGITFNEVDFVIYDMMGRLVRSEKHRTQPFEVHRKQLPSGMYTYQIQGRGQIVATGKIVVR